jgi:hypothetical protein
MRAIFSIGVPQIGNIPTLRTWKIRRARLEEIVGAD